LPAELVAVAAVDRVAEQSLHGVGAKQPEELVRRQIDEVDAAGLQRGEHAVLLRLRQCGEGSAERGLAVGVDARDGGAVAGGRRHPDLPALLRRARGPWTAEIHLGALAVGA